MVEIPDSFAAIHSVKTDTRVWAPNTICDTRARCLPVSPCSTASPTPGGHLKSQSYCGRSREEEVTSQAKWCLTLAWARGIKGAAETWAAPFGTGRGTKSERQREAC